MDLLEAARYSLTVSGKCHDLSGLLIGASFQFYQFVYFLLLRGKPVIAFLKTAMIAGAATLLQYARIAIRQRSESARAGACRV